MPLTEAETDFLAAFIDEYMTVELGPAGRKLRERGIFGAEILHLLDAYSRAHPPRLEGKEVDGRRVEVLVYGQPTPNPPEPPWSDRETALRRNAELLAERDREGKSIMKLTVHRGSKRDRRVVCRADDGNDTARARSRSTPGGRQPRTV